MKNSKLALLFALALSTVCTAIAAGRTLHNEARQEYRLPDPIEEIYEDQEGLHVITKSFDSLGVEYHDILIELEDEKDVYSFAVDGWEYSIKYFRTGNRRKGTTGVFVVLLDQLYSIDSHRLPHSSFYAGK